MKQVLSHYSFLTFVTAISLFWCLPVEGYAQKVRLKAKSTEGSDVVFLSIRLAGRRIGKRISGGLVEVARSSSRFDPFSTFAFVAAARRLSLSERVPSTYLENGEAYYRVRFVSRKDKRSRWSAVRRVSFSDDFPDIPFPIPKQTVTKPEFSEPPITWRAPSVLASQSNCPAGFEEEIVRLVNIERQGLTSLKKSSSLNSSARGHSVEMAASGILSHDGWYQFLAATGFPHKTAGENIAYGYPTPASIVAAWMGSPGHRANILKPQYTHIGVGCVLDEDGVPWWTQHFAG